MPVPDLDARYVVFDIAPDWRTDKRADGVLDPTEQQDFNAFANDPLLMPTINN